MSNHVPQYSNQLLLGLPAAETAQLNPLLVLTPLIARQIVLVRGQRVNDIYLIETGMISLTVGSNGYESEVGLIGYEGGVGISAFMTADTYMVYQGMVQVAGNAQRLNADAAYALVKTCPVFAVRCLRYVDSLLNQTAQVAGCNVRHTVQERMARWLMMTRDRLHSDILPLTQEFLAIMLGVSRGGVALASNTLQAAGLIRQEHGRIVVVNPDGLRSVSCECYGVVHALYDFNQSSTTKPIV